MPYANVEKQRTYQRIWKKEKRAEVKAAKGEANAKPVEERIADLEKELAMLKAEVLPAGLTLNIDSDTEPVQNEREARIQRFGARLGAFSNNRPRSITNYYAGLDDLEKEFGTIVKEGPEFPERVDLRVRLARERETVRKREERAQWLEDQIARWSKGGDERKGLENLLAGEHQKGKRQLTDPDPQVRRAGGALINGCLEKVGEVEVTLGRHKAELAQLRA